MWVKLATTYSKCACLFCVHRTILIHFTKGANIVLLNASLIDCGGVISDSTAEYAVMQPSFISLYTKTHY